MPNKNSLQHTICSMSIGTRILSPSFLHGVSTKHQLWWQNKHFQVPHTSHKAVGGLVANLCSALATPRTVAHTALFVHGIFQVRILEWVCLIVIRIFANLTSILWYLIVMLLCIFLTLNLVYWTFGFLHLRTPSSRLCPLPYWVVVFLLIWTEDYLRILGLWVDKSSDTF